MVRAHPGRVNSKAQGGVTRPWCQGRFRGVGRPTLHKPERGAPRGVELSVSVHWVSWSLRSERSPKTSSRTKAWRTRPQVSGAGFQVSGAKRGSGFRCRVSGFRFQGKGKSRCRVSGFALPFLRQGEKHLNLSDEPESGASTPVHVPIVPMRVKTPVAASMVYMETSFVAEFVT
jgi:hypothetical protein